VPARDKVRALKNVHPVINADHLRGKTCGSALARDGGLSDNANVDCANVIASKRAPTMNAVFYTLYSTPGFRSAACPACCCNRDETMHL